MVATPQGMGVTPTQVWSDSNPPPGANISAIKAKADLIPTDISTQLDTNIPLLLKRLMLFWDAKTNIPIYTAAAGTWSVGVAADLLSASLYNTAQALNDEMRIAFWSPDVNVKTLYIRGGTGAAFGISTILVDGVSQGTIDWYTAGTGWDAVKSIAITPARAGSNVLSLKMATKNGASSAYGLNIAEMWIL